MLGQADYAHARRGETFDSAGDTAIVVGHPPAAGSDLSPPLRRGLLLSPHSGVIRHPRPGAKRGARPVQAGPPTESSKEPERMDDAAYELWRQDFLRQLDEQLSVLRRDPNAWADYQSEAELTYVSDGID